MESFLRIVPFIVAIVGIIILIIVICKMIKYVEALQIKIEKCEKKINHLEVLYNTEKEVIENVSDTDV